MIQIIETIEAFEGLRSDWDARARMPQQTFAWCRAGWDYLRSQDSHARLAIVVFYDEPNTTRLILPTYVDRFGTLRFILDTFADHCDALYAPGENLTLILNAVYKAIRACDQVRFVRLRRLPADSVLLQHVGALDSHTLFREGASLALRLPQAEDLETALPHLYSRDRDKLHRSLRQLAEYTVKLHTAQDGSPFPRERILALKAAMVAQGLRAPDFLTDAFLDFAEVLYRDGVCELAELASEKGEALNLNLRLRETTLLWIILYTDHRLPSLMGLACAREIARGGGTLDFGAGVYSYKNEALRPQAEIAFTLCFGKGLCGWMRATAALVWRQVKDGIKAWKKCR